MQGNLFYRQRKGNTCLLNAAGLGRVRNYVATYSSGGPLHFTVPGIMKYSFGLAQVIHELTLDPHVCRHHLCVSLGCEAWFHL